MLYKHNNKQQQSGDVKKIYKHTYRLSDAECVKRDRQGAEAGEPSGRQGAEAGESGPRESKGKDRERQERADRERVNKACACVCAYKGSCAKVVSVKMYSSSKV